MKNPSFSYRIRKALSGMAMFGLLAFATYPAFADDDKTLNIYNWSDFIGPDTISNFEKETGIKVRYDFFDSNETLHAKLVAGKTGYDIVVPSSDWAKRQVDAGLYLKIDKTKIENYANLDPVALRQLARMDAGNLHLIPYLGGYTSVGINEEKLKEALGDLPMPDNSWDLVFNPEYMRRAKKCGVNFLDSPDDVFATALLYLGKSPSSKVASDYQEAAKLLDKVRPYIETFSASGYINDMANGSLCLSMVWSGDMNIAAARAREAKRPYHIKTLVAKTGGMLFMDTMAIPADAQHVENAYKFISYILRPKVNAELVNATSYANYMPGSLKYIKPELVADTTLFLSAADLTRMVPFESMDADIRRLHNRLYVTFKTGR